MQDRFSKLLVPACINLSVAATQKDAAIDEIAQLLNGREGVADFQGFRKDLFAREQLDTTCFGNAIAIPHSRTTHVKKIVVAVGRSEKGIRYEAVGETARLVFVLGTPKSAPAAYLSIVAMLCRLLRDAANRDVLLRAPTPEAFIQAFVEAENKMLATSPGLPAAAVR